MVFQFTEVGTQALFRADPEAIKVVSLLKMLFSSSALYTIQFPFCPVAVGSHRRICIVVQRCASSVFYWRCNLFLVSRSLFCRSFFFSCFASLAISIVKEVEVFFNFCSSLDVDLSTFEVSSSGIVGYTFLKTTVTSSFSSFGLLKGGRFCIGLFGTAPVSTGAGGGGPAGAAVGDPLGVATGDPEAVGVPGTVGGVLVLAVGEMIVAGVGGGGSNGDGGAVGLFISLVYPSAPFVNRPVLL